MPKSSKTPIERMMSRVTIDPESGCWIWGGALAGGYGLISVEGRLQYTHRLSYEHHVGPIPEGAVIDHVKTRGCISTACCNFEHLEPVKQKENVHRGGLVSSRTHCPHGHEFTAQNTMKGSSGRRCRTCWNEWRRRHRAAAK